MSNTITMSLHEQTLQHSCRSNKSLNNYELKSFKTLLPQIIATGMVMSLNILVGITYGYSAILIPQILAVENSTDSSVIRLSKSEISWIVSCVTLAIPFGSISGGFLMDAFGRLTLLRLVVIPNVVGWLILAFSSNVAMVISGRVITGIASGWTLNTASVYISEISRKDIRGSLISTCTLGVSIGLVVVYIKGWFLGWQVVAGINIGYSIFSALLLFLIPESPAWLVSKNYPNQALKALEWFHKYQPQCDGKDLSFAEAQFTALEEEKLAHIKESEAFRKDGIFQKLKMFAKPSGYKPMLIILGIFYFQNFSGMFVLIFNGIIFFQDTGVNIDPYQATIYISCMRLLVTIANIFLMKKFNRRSLMMFSGIVMGLFMGISGFSTMCLKKGISTSTWIPLVSLMIYFIAAAMGFLTIPFSLQAEVFPLRIRGIATSITYSISNLLTFGSLQTYFLFLELFGGSFGVQFFYAITSFAGFVFVFVFMPETHNKTLSEIEMYFWKHTTFLSVYRLKNQPPEVNELNNLIK